jgi:hypothetical protein
MTLDYYDKWLMWHRYQQQTDDHGHQQPWELLSQWLLPHKHEWILLAFSILEMMIFIFCLTGIIKIIISELKKKQEKMQRKQYNDDDEAIKIKNNDKKHHDQPRQHQCHPHQELTTMFVISLVFFIS